jgi:hypothetical protein
MNGGAGGLFHAFFITFFGCFVKVVALCYKNKGLQAEKNS